MRLHITGNAGAGKTTLAKELATALDLPLHHMDSIVWLPGWQKPDAETRKQQEQAIAAGDSWVIEGVSDYVRSQADLTLFLDVPRHICMFRCFRRNLPYLFKSRPELPNGCPEILIVRKLVSIIWRFPTNAGARIAGEALATGRVMRVYDSGQALTAVKKWRTSATPNMVLQRDVLSSAFLGCRQATPNSSAPEHWC